MATIQDVANEAKVSTATVSRVINGSYAVTEEKKRLVMEAIKKVGYTLPNRTRKNLRIPVGEKRILLQICNEFITPILSAFQSAASELGYQAVTIQYNNADYFDQIASMVSTLSPLLAGVCLINCIDNSQRFQDLVGQFPVVQIGEPIFTDAPNMVVYNDEIKMAEDAADYLLEHGRRKIGILTSEPIESIALFQSRKRENGYYLSLINHFIPVDHSLVEYVDISIEGGYEGAKKLLSRHANLDAIIGITDVIAQGAVYAVRRAGKSTEEVAIFSMESSEVWDFSHGTFPYIDPHLDDMGTMAAQVLNNIITGAITGDYRLIIPHTLSITTNSSAEAVE